MLRPQRQFLTTGDSVGHVPKKPLPEDHLNPAKVTEGASTSGAAQLGLPDSTSAST
jgi:hypothetical protein